MRFIQRIIGTIFGLIELAFCWFYCKLIQPPANWCLRALDFVVSRFGLIGVALEYIRTSIGHAFGSSIFAVGKEVTTSARFKWLRVLLFPIVVLFRAPIYIMFAGIRIYERLEISLAESFWLRWLYLILHASRVVISVIAEFFVGWFTTRTYRVLLFAIPAIMLLIPVAFCAVRIPLHSARARASHYRLAAVDAWKEKDFEAARLFYRKIQQLGVLTEEAIYQSAETVAEEGDYETAYPQMLELAEQSEFNPAKLWIARSLIEGNIDVDHDEALDQAAAFTAEVLAVEPDNARAQLIQASIYEAKGEYKQALAQLEIVAKRFPQIQIQVVQVLRKMGQVDKANALAAEMVERLEGDGTYERSTTKIRTLATLYASNGRFRKMEEVVSKGLEKYPNDRRLKRSVTQLYSRLFDQVPDHELKLRMINLVAELSPDDPNITDRLATLAVSDPTRKDIFDKLKPRLEAADDISASIHAKLGVAAFKREDYAAARDHFETVVVAQPSSGSAANNLAWLLSKTEPVELDRALEMANRAVKSIPEDSGFRETRGQIYLKMKRWTDAINDLTKALNGMPNDPAIHASLSTAYEKVGDLELARMHKRLSINIQ